MVTAAQPATTSTFSPLTTWDGWQQFVDTPHAPAREADDQEWTLEQREDYHARFVVLKTPPWTPSPPRYAACCCSTAASRAEPGAA
nr:hypothetical protein [Streptomyces sp. C8S0]